MRGLVVQPLVLLQIAVAMVAAAVLPPLLSPAYPAEDTSPGVSVCRLVPPPVLVGE